MSTCNHDRRLVGFHVPEFDCWVTNAKSSEVSKHRPQSRVKHCDLTLEIPLLKAQTGELFSVSSPERSYSSSFVGRFGSLQLKLKWGACRLRLTAESDLPFGVDFVLKH